jgi:hypothetical protein
MASESSGTQGITNVGGEDVLCGIAHAGCRIMHHTGVDQTGQIYGWHEFSINFFATDVTLSD